MSVLHREFMLAILRVGTPSDEVFNLVDFSIPEDQTLAISDDFMPVAEGSYDPMLTPDWTSGPGVYYSGKQCAVVGSDSQLCFYFLFQ